MGLSNKLATKIRTAGKSIPVSLPGHWDDNGMLIASAIVRGGAAVIGQLKLTSSGARGKDFLGIREARTKAPSTVWVEQLGLKEWCVSLGQATVAGPALDWQVRLKFSASATGDMAELTTPAMATRDGTLVNKRAHGELRDLLVTGLAQGRAPASGAERAVSDGGLSALTLPPFARIDTAKLLSAVIGTRLSGADLVGCLRLVPYAVLAADEDSIGWRLGEGEAMSGQIVTAVIQDARLVQVDPAPLRADAHGPGFHRRARVSAGQGAGRDRVPADLDA